VPEAILLCKTHLEIYLAAVEVAIPSLQDLALTRFLHRLSQIIQANDKHRVVARIVELVTELTTNHDEINGGVVACAAANHAMVTKNQQLVTVLVQKYGWRWRLALDAHGFVAISEPESSM